MSVRSKKVAESVFEVLPADDSALWPEWNDTVLNKENWAIPKNGSDGLFLDTQLVQLPPSLESHEWIRAKDQENLTEPLTVFVANSQYPDLITNNRHLLHSQYCGRDGLEISGENGNFIWNGRYQSWQGWLHVYSMNKAGKGAQHRPVVNPHGKYIVRLYFMGAWRRIMVDDMIPLNTEKLPLLPRTGNNYELWPMILSKAILKLCSLTWFGHHEIIDFHPVTCLTGWVCMRLEIGYLSPQDKWDFLGKYAERFEWKMESTELESQTASKSKKSKDEKTKGTARTKESKETGKSKKSKDDDSKMTKDTGRSKKSKEIDPKLKVLSKPQPVTVYLGLEDMKEDYKEIVPELAPCLSHFIYVTQSRDIPLDPKDVKPPLARWKLYRWLKWAIGQGIIDPIEYFVPIRSLRIVSPLKKCEESVINKFSNENVEENVLDDSTTNKESKKEKSDQKKKKSRDKSVERQKQTSVEPLEDISFWADFNKIEPHIKDVHFFYKLDYFQYTAKFSDRFAAKQAEQKSDKKGSRRSSPAKTVFKEQEFVDTHCWSQEMSKTRNEPLYIFTDSTEEKFFLIDFSAFQVSVRTVPENVNQTSNTLTALTANKNSLCIEKHNLFHKPEKSNHLISVQTAGTKSTVLQLNSGRFLLRMYCHSEPDCFATISSDTIFHVGDKRKMYQLMITESETIDQMAKHISVAINNAYQAFGTERQAETLKEYYKSYLPPKKNSEKSNKVFNDQIHDYLISEKVKLIRKIMPENEIPGVIRSLRIFFLKPTIGMECFSAVTRMLNTLRALSVSRSLSENSRHNSEPKEHPVLTFLKNRAACIIQSYLKAFLIKKYKRIHDPKHEEHQQVSENLSKIADLFNYNRRESIANQLLRNLIKSHDKLYDLYHCSKDFEYTLQIQELTGTLTNVKPNEWLPITRFMVSPRVTETVLADIDLFVNFPRYCVRVFNNQTGEEMLRIANNVVPTHYPYMKLGYTIFCYGWSEDQQFNELPWSLTIITMKGQPVFHFLENETLLPTIAAPPDLLIQELSNNYIPNACNYVCKGVVRVVRPSVVSFRIRTSYENVRMMFRVIDEDETVLAEVKGTSVIILPMVYLGLRMKRKETMYKSRTAYGDGDNIDRSFIERPSIKSSARSTLTTRASVKSHIRSLKGTIHIRGDVSKDEMVYDKNYYVEAVVLDDSWPLTKSEWSHVSEFRIKPTGSLIKIRLSSSNTGRLSKSESLRSKRSSKQSVHSGPTLESPYWILQVVTDAESELEISQDRTKEIEIAKMKEAWAEENPDSLERGRELREAFIKKHEVKPESSTSLFETKLSSHSGEFSKGESRESMSADTSMTSMVRLEDRTLKPPASLRRLPPLDLSVYEVKDDEEDKPWVKTESDEVMLRNNRLMSIIYAKEDYMHFLEDLECLIENQKEHYETMYGKYREDFWDRRYILNEIYENFRDYISSMKPAVASSVKSTGKKSKKSKKS
ncbi:ADGB [Anthophora plagiata]